MPTGTERRCDRDLTQVKTYVTFVPETITWSRVRELNPLGLLTEEDRHRGDAAEDVAAQGEVGPRALVTSPVREIAWWTWPESHRLTLRARQRRILMHKPVWRPTCLSSMPL